MKKRSSIEIKNNYGIIYTTGPDIISTVYDMNNKVKNDVLLLERNEVNHLGIGHWRE